MNASHKLRLRARGLVWARHRAALLPGVVFCYWLDGIMYSHECDEHGNERRERE